MGTGKTIVQRNLPLSDTYSLVSATVGSGDGWCCENCGKFITNLATVKNQDGKHFVIGMDCMKTLTTKNIYLRDGRTSEELLYAYNCFLRFLTACNKPDAVLDDMGSGGYLWQVQYAGKDGKIKSTTEFRGTIEEFYGWDKFESNYKGKIQVQ